MATRPFVAARPARQGLWFPLGMAALLLLALPGAVLLALSLLGKEGPANTWLQSRLGLSFHNPVPRWAGLLIFLIPLLLILLYFLKLRRKPVQVPSTFLWRKSVEDLHVNSLFQWLRDNVLLLIQLLVLLLLIYALLALQVHGRTTSGGHYILILDSSASMAVTDVAPSRLEAAKQEALREIDARGDGDAGMVIEFNSRATLRQPYTTDKGLLRAAVNAVTQTQRTSNVEEALALAASLSNLHQSTDDAAVRPPGEDPAEARTYVSPEGIAADVHLYSDGRFPDVPSFAAGKLTLNYHRVGQPGPDAADNLGVVNFNAVRDEKDPSKLLVYVRVLNFRKDPADVTVELSWGKAGQADGLKDQTRTLKGRAYKPGDPEKNVDGQDEPGEGVFTFDLEVEDTGDLVLHAKLKGTRDQFPLDDQAWLVAGVVRKARVLLVSDSTELLRKASGDDRDKDPLRRFLDLKSTRAVAEVEYLRPADLTDRDKYLRPARDGQYDLTIFDRCAPADVDALPAGNTFFVGAAPPPWKGPFPPLKDTRVRNRTSTHALMRDVTGLDEIVFFDAFQFDLKAEGVPPRVPRLLETGKENAVLFALPRRSYTDLVMAFPLITAEGKYATDWFKQSSFLVFLHNLLYTLGHVSDAAAERSVSPGEVMVLRPDGAVDEVTVTDPAGGRRGVRRSAGREFVYRDTERVGVYRAAWPGGGRGFAVNLLDELESNVQPRDDLRLGAQRVEAGAARRQTHETWKWVALGALAVLLLEWVVYHRRLFF